MSEEMVIIQDEIIKQQEVVVKTADEYIRALTEMNGLLSEKSQDSKQENQGFRNKRKRKMRLVDKDETINAKMNQNEAKYPVEKKPGRAAKYDEL